MAQRRKTDRIEVRFNPAASHIDAVLLVKLESVPVAASVLIKNLLMNYFAAQPGGIGLKPEELEAFSKLCPFGKKNGTAGEKKSVQTKKWLHLKPARRCLGKHWQLNVECP